MANNNDMSSKDLLLLLLYMPGITGKENEKIDGKTRLTKMFFIFDKEIKVKMKDINIIIPEFIAFKFGPFSQEVIDDLNFFINLGFIIEEARDESDIIEAEFRELELEIDESSIGDTPDDELAHLFNSEERKFFSYKLSQNGIKYVQTKLIDKLYSDQKEVLEVFKTKINSLTLPQILDYVYNKYEDMTVNSEIKDIYLKK